MRRSWGNIQEAACGAETSRSVVPSRCPDTNTCCIGIAWVLTWSQSMMVRGPKPPRWKSTSWHSTQPPASVSSSLITSRALHNEGEGGSA